MKKRLLSLLLAIVMTCTLLPTTAWAEDWGSGDCGDNMTWVLDGDGTLTISGSGEMYDYGSAGPWQQYGVYMRKIVVGDNVTSIGRYAFADLELVTEVQLPDSVTKINDYAFDGCTDLATFDIPSNVTHIGNYAFNDCTNLRSVTIPTGVTAIGYGVFSYCKRLASVTMHDGITSIGGNAFSQCYALSSIDIPEAMEIIAQGAFDGCNALKTVRYGGSAAQWKALTISDYNTCLTSAQIECGKVDPIAVTAVPQHKYVGCGNSGTKAPADCYVDDDGVYYVVDSDAAQNTITLTNSGETFQARLATVFGSASNWDPNAEVVEGGHMMALVKENVAYINPDSGNVGKAVNEYRCAFCGKHFFGSDYQYSPDQAWAMDYEYASHLIEAGFVRLSADMELGSVKYYWRYDSSAIAALEAPVLSGSIDRYGQPVLTWPEVIGADIYRVWMCCISDSDEYGIVRALRDNEYTGNLAEFEEGKEYGFKVLACSSDGRNSEFSNEFTFTYHTQKPEPTEDMSGKYGANISWMLKNGVLTISGSGTMESDEAAPWTSGALRNEVRQVVVQQGVTTIGEGAFRDCFYLTSVKLPASGLTKIGESAFYGCANLTAISIPDGVQSIEGWAFVFCRKLTSVTVPGSVKTVGDNAFAVCSGLTDITFGEGVQSLGTVALAGCTALRTLWLPRSLTSIGDSATYDIAIRDVYYGGSQADWNKISIGLDNTGLDNATIHYIGLGVPAMTVKLGSDGKPVVSWTKVNGAAQYEMYRSDTGKDNTFKIVRRTAGLTFTDTNTVAGKTYYYVVRAIDGGTTGKFCAARSVTVPGALGVPTMTLKLGSDGKPVVSWTKVTGAAQYEVYRSLTGKANSYSIVRRTAGLTFTDTTAATGKTYYYVLRAINGGTAGKFCAAKSVAVALGVPTMTVKLGSDGKPVVSWTKVAGAAQYEVYRSLTGKANSYSIIRRTAGLTFTDTTAATGKTYYYVVRAINGGAAGKFCAAKSVTAQMALGVPTMTLGIDLSDGLTTVWWSKVANAAQYEIYRSDSGKSGTFKIVRRTAGTFWKDNTAQVGKTYYYTVRAMRGSGTSVVYGGFCPVQERVCSQPPTLEPPYFYYMALNSSGKPVLKWEGVPDADYYVIFRTDNNGFSISDIGYVEAGSELTYTDTTAVAGVRYGYSVSCETYEGAYSAPSDQYYITAR